VHIPSWLIERADSEVRIEVDTFLEDDSGVCLALKKAAPGGAEQDTGGSVFDWTPVVQTKPTAAKQANERQWFALEPETIAMIDEGGKSCVRRTYRIDDLAAIYQKAAGTIVGQLWLTKPGEPSPCDSEEQLLVWDTLRTYGQRAGPITFPPGYPQAQYATPRASRSLQQALDQAFLGNTISSGGGIGGRFILSARGRFRAGQEPSGEATLWRSSKRSN